MIHHHLSTAIHAALAADDRCLGDCSEPTAVTTAHSHRRDIELLLRRVATIERERDSYRDELIRRGECQSCLAIRDRYLRALELVAHWRSKYDDVTRKLTKVLEGI